MTLKIDNRIIGNMLEKLGYRVKWIHSDILEALDWQQIQVLFTDATMCAPKNFGKTKRKIESQSPFHVNGLYFTHSYRDELFKKVIYMTIEDNVSNFAISDLVSTFEAQP